MKKNNIFLSLSENLQIKLKELQIENATNVQQKIIPMILEKQNIIFESETGTGKTFTYLLPLINNIEKDSDNTACKVIVIAPTFELASQINTAAKSVTSLKTALIIGGAPIKRQLDNLKEKPQIIIGTTARIIELIKLKKLKVHMLKAIVFDEADRLTKKETKSDTLELLKLIPQNVQKIACTATVNNATKTFFNDLQAIIMPKEDILQQKITHWAIFAEQRDKIETLRKFLNAEQPKKALIFTSRADQVENIYQKLTYKNIECSALHAKEDKQKRKQSIDRFRSGKSSLLITSDLAARGLDIQDVTHIIQMDLPSDDDFFIHRSGRTARAGKSGINVVIGDEYEMNHYAALEKKLKITVYPKEIHNGKICVPQL